MRSRSSSSAGSAHHRHPGHEGLLPLPSGRSVPWRIRRHRTARTFVLRVSRGAIQLTIPTRGSQKAALAWALDQASFIEEQLAGEPRPEPLQMGAVIPVLGEEVLVTPGLKRTGEWAESALRILPGQPQALGKRIELCLRARALAEARQRLGGYWTELGVSSAPVSVRSYRRRWGACGADGATSINWRLIFAPDWVFSAVVAHEAAHRIAMNHSPAFYAVLDRLDPRRREAESWLRSRGAELYRWTVPDA